MKILKEGKLKEAAQHSKELFKLIDSAVDKVDLNENDDIIYIEEICTTFGRYVGTMLARFKESTDDQKLLSKLTDKTVFEFFKAGVNLV